MSITRPEENPKNIYCKSNFSLNSLLEQYRPLAVSYITGGQ